MSRSASACLHALSLVAIRLAATVVVLALGFEALSDDDYARVALAQTFAHSPRWDPTGTSWLPLPFWVNGVVMSALGRDLAVARGVTIVLGCLSSVLLYACARASGVRAWPAWCGAVAATLVPLSVVAGAAMVPELPTASLCAASIVLLAHKDPRAALASSALVLPATLCRYEAWPVAAFVAAYAALAALRAARLPARDGRSREVATNLLAVALAVAGPGAWLAWNAHAHGDAFHFHARVATFWSAWGATHGADLWSGALTYPRAMLTESPVLLIALAGAAWWARSSSALRRWIAPVACASFVIVALSAAQATGGAPTHHPERPLLMLWLAGWIAVADLAAIAPVRRARTASIAVLAVAVIAWLSLRLAHVASYGVHRTQELQAGAWMHDHAPRGDVLLEPDDYGYFAIVAGLGAPERVVLGRSVDPRAAPSPSPFRDDAALRSRLVDTDIRWMVGRGTAGNTAARVGTERARFGDWAIVERADED